MTCHRSHHQGPAKPYSGISVIFIPPWGGINYLRVIVFSLPDPDESESGPVFIKGMSMTGKGTIRGKRNAVRRTLEAMSGLDKFSQDPTVQRLYEVCVCVYIYVYVCIFIYLNICVCVFTYEKEKKTRYLFANFLPRKSAVGLLCCTQRPSRPSVRRPRGARLCDG